MLQEKTRGNRTAQEARLLANMLFDLRMLCLPIVARILYVLASLPTISSLPAGPASSEFTARPPGRTCDLRLRRRVSTPLARRRSGAGRARIRARAERTACGAP